jgi:hypothetical protein
LGGGDFPGGFGGEYKLDFGGGGFDFGGGGGFDFGGVPFDGVEYKGVFERDGGGGARYEALDVPAPPPCPGGGAPFFFVVVVVVVALAAGTSGLLLPTEGSDVDGFASGATFEEGIAITLGGLGEEILLGSGAAMFVTGDTAGLAPLGTTGFDEDE